MAVLFNDLRQMEWVLAKRTEPDLEIGRLRIPHFDRCMSISWTALRSLRPKRQIRDDALEFYIHLLLKDQVCLLDV